VPTDDFIRADPDETFLAALRALGTRLDPPPQRLRVEALAAFASRTVDAGVGASVAPGRVPRRQTSARRSPRRCRARVRHAERG